MHVIIVCRMGSKRLSGKTLRKVGGNVLLGLQINRVLKAGISEKDIVIATSTNSEDDAIEQYAKGKGIRFFRGSALNVAQRLLSAAELFELQDFLLLLGDNPWIDIDMLKRISDRAKTSNQGYLVSATPELPENITVEKYHPAGTRIQWISKRLFSELYFKCQNTEASEHISLLFRGVTSKRGVILEPSSGFTKDQIRGINLSVNTEADLQLAVTIENTLGQNATVSEIVTFVRGVRN